MTTLSKNWLTEGLVDFEYKKYLLLAYLQEVGRNFSEKKIYPRLAEIVEHHKNLKLLQERKTLLSNEFPREISRLDFEQFRLEYKMLNQDDDLIKEIDDIIEFALPAIEKHFNQGKELYEEVECKAAIFPVGIIPLKNDEGYFFLSDKNRKSVTVFEYRVTLFETADEKLRGIHTLPLTEYRISVSQTYEGMKFRLIRERKELPNPATYVIEFKHSYPFPETMLPVAKRMLLRHISHS